MNKQKIGRELQVQLEKRHDIVGISRWAFQIYSENCRDLDPSCREILECLFSMEDDPQFEFTEKELRLLTEMLMNDEEDPIKKINDLKQKK